MTAIIDSINKLYRTEITEVEDFVKTTIQSPKPFMYTFTGRKFDFLNPVPESISLVDIHTALKNIVRFNGHVNNRYKENGYSSVLGHSILMCCLFDDMLRMSVNTIDDKEANLIRQAILLHDASEAYTGDINPRLKKVLSDYPEIEDNITEAVYKKYLSVVLTEKEEKFIKFLDHAAFMLEASEAKFYKEGTTEKLCCHVSFIDHYINERFYQSMMVEEAYLLLLKYSDCFCQFFGKIFEEES